MKWPKWMLHTQHITSQLRSPELRKAQTIMASMQFAHLPLSETLSLFFWIANKAALCSRGKHYVCLTRLSAMKTSLKRQTRTKGNQCLSEVQKCKRIVFQQKHFYRKYLSITGLKEPHSVGTSSWQLNQTISTNIISNGAKET